MAQKKYLQSFEIGGKKGSIKRNEAFGEAWPWNRFKFVSAILGWVAILVGILLLGYWLGNQAPSVPVTTSSLPTPTPVASSASTPTTVRVVVPGLKETAEELRRMAKSFPPPQPQSRQELSPAELERRFKERLRQDGDW